MRRRVLRIEFESRYSARVSGENARGLIMELTGGKLPVWSSIAKAYTIGERRARDLVALGEARGYDVIVHGPRAAALSTSASPAVECPEPGDLLW